MTTSNISRVLKGSSKSLINPFDSSNDNPGDDLYSYISDLSKVQIGNNTNVLFITPEHLINCIDDKDIVEMPAGLYTNESFTKDIMDKIAGRPLEFKASQLINLKLDLPIWAEYTTLINTSFKNGGVISNSAVYHDNYDIQFKGVAMYDVKLSYGARFHDCRLTNCTSNFGEFSGDSIVRGGFHNFANCKDASVKIVNFYDEINLPKDLNDYLINHDNFKDIEIMQIYTDGRFGIDPFSHYVPLFNENVNIKSSIEGKIPPKDLMGKLKRVDLSNSGDAQIHQAYLINAIINSDEFCGGGLAVSCIYVHSNGKIDYSKDGISIPANHLSRNVQYERNQIKKDLDYIRNLQEIKHASIQEGSLNNSIKNMEKGHQGDLLGIGTYDEKVIDNLKKELNNKMLINKMNYQKEKEIYLNTGMDVGTIDEVVKHIASIHECQSFNLQIDMFNNTNEIVKDIYEIDDIFVKEINVIKSDPELLLEFNNRLQKVSPSTPQLEGLDL